MLKSCDIAITTQEHTALYDDVQHCLSAIQEANTLTVVMVNKSHVRSESSSNGSSIGELKNEYVDHLAQLGVPRSVARHRLRVHVVNTVTGEKVDSAFRDIARELRADVTEHAHAEATPMDIDN